MEGQKPEQGRFFPSSARYRVNKGETSNVE
jgi:hypothetical protein